MVILFYMAHYLGHKDCNDTHAETEAIFPGLHNDEPKQTLHSAL
jgi:hypothetical protein